MIGILKSDKQQAEIETVHDEIGLVELKTKLNDRYFYKLEDIVIQDDLNESDEQGEQIFVVQVPAIVYKNSFYGLGVIQIKVLAQDSTDACEIVNSHKKQVQKYFSNQYIGRKKLVLSKEGDLQIFWKNDYYAKKHAHSKGRDVLSRFGSFVSA